MRHFVDKKSEPQSQPAQESAKNQAEKQNNSPVERGGPKGPEPTRYGDWEVGGICSDF
jgi:hypothetical protein